MLIAPAADAPALSDSFKSHGSFAGYLPQRMLKWPKWPKLAVSKLAVLQSKELVLTCLQSPGAQHAAWFRELQCESMLMAVHDNLYKMEEYAVHSSTEAYVGTLGKQTPFTGVQPFQITCKKPTSTFGTVMQRELLKSLPSCTLSEQSVGANGLIMLNGLLGCCTWAIVM